MKKTEKISILRIKEIMQEKGVSRDDLANKVGVSATTISNICSDESFPKPKLLVKIAEVFDVDIRELFIPTKGTVITENELVQARELIENGLKILNGKV